MRQINTFSDRRFDYNCSYCGNGMETETRDHVPSKVLLDKPFPENLPVVLSCYSCNQDFSLDEEYFACLIECAKFGTTEFENLQREKVKRILQKRPLLKKRLEDSKIESKGQVSFKIESDRFEKVIIKLVKGHAKYEYSEPKIGKPSHLWFGTLGSLSQEELDRFLSIENPMINKVPEIGSRAFHRVFATNAGFIVQEKWIEVQEGNYSYMTEDFWNGKKVKLIIGEYLAVEAAWIDEYLKNEKENSGSFFH